MEEGVSVTALKIEVVLESVSVDKTEDLLFWAPIAGAARLSREMKGEDFLENDLAVETFGVLDVESVYKSDARTCCASILSLVGVFLSAAETSGCREKVPFFAFAEAF